MRARLPRITRVSAGSIQPSGSALFPLPDPGADRRNESALGANLPTGTGTASAGAANLGAAPAAEPLQIDLEGLESKWSKGKSACAVCGFDFDNQDPVDAEDGCEVPLLLFRGKGKRMLMLSLCWTCATVRMQRKESN
jgi:hypothetical protein